MENTIWRHKIVTRRDVFMALCKVLGNGHLHYWQLRMQTISSNIPIPACNAFPAPKCVVACHRWDNSIQPHYWQMTTKITGFLERKKNPFLFTMFPQIFKLQKSLIFQLLILLFKAKINFLNSSKKVAYIKWNPEKLV